MKAIEAVKVAANNAGIPITHIGRTLGKRDNYVSSLIRQNKARNSSLQINTAAAMLKVCGYSLCAVPSDAIPAGALVIDDATAAGNGNDTAAASTV